MPQPRYKQVIPEITPYYHCTSRCVRRAHLCGKDRETGRSFAHRKIWIERRIIRLAQIFAIDVVSYAVMSNHYHVVVHLDVKRARKWSDEEIVKRWSMFHKIPKWITGPPSGADRDGHISRVSRQVSIWRERLTSLSWFMGAINEPLARLANKEDGCKGRFWEGRFTSQGLLGEAAVLTCMAYVDLNPVRAGLAVTPESSRHTSIRRRIRGRTRGMMPFSDEAGLSNTKTLPIRYAAYLQLVDWSGRVIRNGKSGAIAGELPPILDRINSTQTWCATLINYAARHGRFVGTAERMREACARLGQRWLRGAPLA